MIAGYEAVGWVFWVDGGVDFTPGNHGQWLVADSRVNGRTVFGVPYDERVILADSNEESFVWREGQLVDAFHHAFENG